MAPQLHWLRVTDKRGHGVYPCVYQCATTTDNVVLEVFDTQVHMLVSLDTDNGVHAVILDNTDGKIAHKHVISSHIDQQDLVPSNVLNAVVAVGKYGNLVVAPGLTAIDYKYLMDYFAIKNAQPIFYKDKFQLRRTLDAPSLARHRNMNVKIFTDLSTKNNISEANGTAADIFTFLRSLVNQDMSSSLAQWFVYTLDLEDMSLSGACLGSPSQFRIKYINAETLGRTSEQFRQFLLHHKILAKIRAMRANSMLQLRLVETIVQQFCRQRPGAHVAEITDIRFFTPECHAGLSIVQLCAGCDTLLDNIARYLVRDNVDVSHNHLNAITIATEMPPAIICQDSEPEHSFRARERRICLAPHHASAQPSFSALTDTAPLDATKNSTTNSITCIWPEHRAWDTQENVLRYLLDISDSDSGLISAEDSLGLLVEELL